MHRTPLVACCGQTICAVAPHDHRCLYDYAMLQTRQRLGWVYLSKQNFEEHIP